MFRKYKSLFLATFTVLALIFSALCNIFNAENIFASSASISTSGTVSIDVAASGNSASIGTDTVTVNTTCSTGYTVSIKSSVEDTSLYKDGDATSMSKISPSTGTLAAPVSILGNNLGTWGYSLTDSTINGGFIGLNNSPSIIKTSDLPSASGGDQFSVYYGVSVTPQIEAGAYKMSNNGTIVYQLTVPITCQRYTVKFDSNGGTGTMDDQIIYEDIATNLTANTFTKENYVFAGWNTEVDGTGADYSNEHSVTNLTTPEQTITLYAKWAPYTYTINYNINGGTSGSTAATTASYDSAHTLGINGFSRTDYAFYGWSTSATATMPTYANGQTLTAAQVNSLVSGLANGESKTLYAIWGCPANRICYRGNGVADSAMAQQSASASTEIMLMPSNFKRAGYGFAGWNTEADGSGTNYGPMQSITTPSNLGTYGLTLYARWIASAGDLQNWSGCASLAAGTITALRDNRDNNVYAIAKLVDGKCWMIENLRLGGGTAISLTTANTAITTNTTLKAAIKDTASGSGNTVISTIADNTLNTPATTTAANNLTYSYGNYYSFAAAIGSTAAFTTNNGYATTSICPRGWTLPRGGTPVTSNNYYVLTNALVGAPPSNNEYPEGASGTAASKALRQYPNNFVFAGMWYGAANGSRGSYGVYWTGTANNNTNGQAVNARHMIFSSNWLGPAINDSSHKVAHPSIRCFHN